MKPIDFELKPYSTGEPVTRYKFVFRGKEVNMTLDRNIPTQRYIADHLAADRAYEGESLVAMMDALAYGGTFIDVGANCGYFSAVAATVASAVVCFEPNQANVEYLSVNVPNARIIHAAVSDRKGIVRLYLNLDNDGGHSLWQCGDHEWNERTRRACNPKIDVQSVRLDDYFFRRPTVLKIDTEGAELLVLRGASTLLSTPTLRLVICEHNEFGLAQLGHTPNQVINLMESHGFKADTSDTTTIGNWHFTR